MIAELRDMRINAESAKRDEAAAIASMSDIEAKAQRQYEKDLQEGEETRKNVTGSWVNLSSPSAQILSEKGVEISGPILSSA
jgi:hypothetical protein